MNFSGTKKLRREATKTSYKNPKTEIIIDRNCRNKGQTIDFNKRRCLSELHNNNSNLKKEFI